MERKLPITAPWMPVWLGSAPCAMLSPVWKAMMAPATWVAMMISRVMPPRISPTAISWSISTPMEPKSAGSFGNVVDNSGSSTKAKARAKVSRSRAGMAASPSAGKSIRIEPTRAKISMNRKAVAGSQASPTVKAIRPT